MPVTELVDSSPKAMTAPATSVPTTTRMRLNPRKHQLHRSTLEFMLPYNRATSRQSSTRHPIEFHAENCEIRPKHSPKIRRSFAKKSAEICESAADPHLLRLSVDAPYASISRLVTDPGSHSRITSKGRQQTSQSVVDRCWAMDVSTTSSID